MLLTLANISYFYYQHKHLFLSLARKGLFNFDTSFFILAGVSRRIGVSRPENAGLAG